MINNKKGLSTVVTTLIIILLVLVAIGIIWVVVRSVIDDSANQIDINTKCVSSNLELTSASCVSGGACTVSIKKSGGYEFDGLQAVYSSPTDSSDPEDEAGDVTVTKTFTFTPANPPVAAGAGKISVAAYFNNTEGVKVLCPQVSEVDITAA